MTNKTNALAVTIAGLALSGCAVYDGAVYTSYDQVDVSIRSAPETATPFSINFGRQRAEVSFVPHKDGQDFGEAVSVFGRASTSSIIPSKVIGGAATAATNAVQTANKNLEDAITARTKANTAATDAAKAAVAANAAATDAAVARVAAAATRSEETAELKVVDQRALATSNAADRLLNRTRAAEEVARDSADQAGRSLAALQTLQTGTSGLQLLRAEGRFASGNAAKLLVIPAGKQVVIAKPGGKELDLGILTTTPVQRAAVFIADARFDVKIQQSLRDLLGDVANVQKCTPQQQDNVYSLAMNTVDTCFSTIAQGFAAAATAADRFRAAYPLYRVDNPSQCTAIGNLGTKEEKTQKVFNALNKSYNKFCNP